MEFAGDGMLDAQLGLPIAVLLLFSTGLVYTVFSAYLYFRSERSTNQKNVPVALAALTIHYGLLFGFPSEVEYSRPYYPSARF
jgi:hypothetical protein